MFYVEHEPSLRALPIILVDAMLAVDAASVAEGENDARTFAAALASARESVAAGRWEMADSALADASRALQTWRGTPDNQAIFDLWYLQGVTSMERAGASAEDFRNAAAMAWNRNAQLPIDRERYTKAYYSAVGQLLREPPGTLVVEPGVGAPTYFLDGIELGPAPIRVQLFAGVHRLNATDGRRSLDWRRMITVHPAATTTARARFPGGSDPERIAGELAQAVSTHQISEEVSELLSGWTERTGVRTIRVLRLDESARGKGRPDVPVFSVHDVYYSPSLRRFSAR